MLEGGPAMGYLLALDQAYRERQVPSKVLFSGYCVEESNGWYLQNKQQVYMKKKNVKKAKPIQISLPVSLHHLSAHSDRTALLAFIKKANPGKVVCVHGDRIDEFVADLRGMGYDAIGPKNGDIITL
jgi:predicted metal-dependent RNase